MVERHLDKVLVVGSSPIGPTTFLCPHGGTGRHSELKIRFFGGSTPSADTSCSFSLRLVVELVDTPDLGSGAGKLAAGSSPAGATTLSCSCGGIQTPEIESAGHNAP